MSTPAAPAVTIQTLARIKREGRRIVMATAYDAISARWVQAGGIDAILVGDSLANTSLGHPDTIAATLDTMIAHCAAVARGSSRPLLIGDLPFMSYKVSPEQALQSAARMMQEGRMMAVKLEGGSEMAPTVLRLARAGIPVLGHVGLLPQSVHALGGYRLQGRDELGGERLMEDALALEEAGAFAVVLEMIPAPLADRISRRLAVPTIGIGAGAGCDGQVLVLADLLGMTGAPPYKFVRPYASLMDQAVGALGAWAEDVRQGRFPAAEQTP